MEEKAQNQKISVSKKVIKLLVDKENFLSNILTLNMKVILKMFYQER